MANKYLYRVKFEYDDYSFYPKIVVYRFKIVRETECYYFIHCHKNKELIMSERKVMKKAIKGYARPTILEAVKDFEARQRRRKIFLEQDLKNIELALETLKKKDSVDDLVNDKSVCL